MLDYMRPFVRVLAAFLATYGAGLVGFLFVDAGDANWYASLAKPALTPSVATFAIVWLILYGLTAAALAIVWTRKVPAEHSSGWVRFFFIQLLFSMCYTMFFFGFHSAFIAFMDILFLGAIVLALTASAADIDRRAVYLMTPYFLWILFAGYLTMGVWLLN